MPNTNIKYNLHLIEPTLYDQTGHGYSYVSSLLQANSYAKFSITVWLDRRGRHLLDDFICTVNTFFIRKIRQIQKYFLYKKLLQQNANLFIGTADFLDIKICNFLLNRYNKGKVFLHFHQFGTKKSKLNFLQKIAKQQGDIVFLAPTPGLVDIFVKSGIKNAHVVPCSSYPRDTLVSDKHIPEFKKVIFAGAARSDKGFAQVVDLIEFCKMQNKSINFNLQTSAPNSGRYDQKTIHALSKLKLLDYPNLITQTATLDKNQYLDFFKNSICLLLYDVAQYHNKFSGVALDAFNNACPLVTASNTWMGDTVAKYNAGIVVDDYKPQTVLVALELIMCNYSQFSANALLAAEQLEKIHNPKYTLDLVASYL